MTTATEPSITLTPTARLARSQQRAFAIAQTQQHQGAWLSPNILSIAAWLAQLQHEYFLASDDDRVPIDASQARVLWQSLIADGVFIGEPEVAELAQRAWRLLHEYQLTAPDAWDNTALSEDNRRFRQWCIAFQTQCQQQRLVDEWAFAAELPGHVASGAVSVPATIELLGFDLPATPLQLKILTAFEHAGSRISQQPSAAPLPRLSGVQPYATAEQELRGAALWARERLQQQPQQAIAVVVPDLPNRVAAVERAFRQTFDEPGFTLRAANPEPWHISLGIALANWELVTDALAFIGVTHHRLSQPQATRWLRSPYLRGWPEEAMQRNETLAWLQQRAPYHLTTNELQHALQGHRAPVLAQALQQWQAARQAHEQGNWPSQWCAHFQQELSLLGFGLGRTLHSNEYQALQRWHQLLEAFATLDVVVTTPISRERALLLLQQRARSAVFREQNPGVPIEVLGVEEALGSRFDALWLATVDSDTWPGPLQRDPLIPIALQTAEHCKLPRATSERCLARAQQELSSLCSAAACVAASYATGTDEIALQPAALIDAATLLPVPADLEFALAPLAAPVDDAIAPAFDGIVVGGGTAVLHQQSACPFRAFAERRLGATALQAPRPGLSAGQRGTVIHAALQQFWQGVNDATELRALTDAAQSALVQAAVQQALTELTRQFRLTLSSANRELEQLRTERTVNRWLNLERQREDFRVLGHEQAITLTLAGLQLTGKIDRLDQLNNGATLLLDYKTGAAAGKNDWWPQARIKDPQLPAYAICLSPQPDAIGFARIRADEMKFDGLSATATGTRGIVELEKVTGNYRELDDWPALLDAWLEQLEGLAQQFANGVADVDPRDAATCRHCHLQALCRISERGIALEEETSAIDD